MADEIERIEKDLEKHGFPLEIRILHILENNGWNITSRYSFFDKETAKASEVDCLATKGVLSGQKIGINEDLLSFVENSLDSLRLIIECKKSSKPWVFYTTPQDNLSILFTKYLGDSPAKFSINEQDNISNQELVKNLHQYSIKAARATNYFEPFTEGKGNQIFDATNKVVKALSYDMDMMKSFVKTRKFTGFFLSYYPLIVFEGNLYQCSIEEEGEKFSRTEYLQLDCHYLGEIYRIDVISSDFFVEFLRRLELELKYMKKLYAEKSQPRRPV